MRLQVLRNGGDGGPVGWMDGCSRDGGILLKVESVEGRWLRREA